MKLRPSRWLKWQSGQAMAEYWVTIPGSIMIMLSENDRTTVAYEVTSGCDPAISHWTLGLPDGLRDKVLSTSEAYEWGVDPNTGVSGIKFDTGYDVGGGGGGGKGKGKAMGGVMLASFNRNSASTLPAPVTMDSRTVLITLSGYYDWSLTEVAIKAGTEIYHSVITAPTTPADPEEEQDQCQ
jgi:hypothetical protein